LSGLKKKDVAQYARICRDESALEFWGYDYRDDEPFSEDGYFYDCQRRELERGTSVTFGVRYRGNLIGEAALYAFDYRGGAQISFRILPEYRGRGLGRKTLLALFSAAENIGLNTLYATVCNKNIPSTSLISQYMDKENEKDGVVRFVLRGE
jgi:RimJ/RimL family protein N-acetyltransferase